MAAYALARIHGGHVGGASRATIDNIALFWQGAALQGLLGIAAVQGLPRWLG